MTTQEIERFKQKLLTEKSNLESQLSTVGQKGSSNTEDWQPTANGIEVDAADENEVADKLEEYEENNGILKQLESQLKEVDAALERITNGTYGICEICGKPIEKERLEANPSARNSIKHSH